MIRKGARRAPLRGSASVAAPQQHDCLNMLRMEKSLASFVRLLGRGRARAKEEPGPCSRSAATAPARRGLLCSSSSPPLPSPVLLLLLLRLLFLWFVCQIRRVSMVHEGNKYC